MVASANLQLERGGPAMVDVCAQVSNAIYWAVAIPRHAVQVEADGGLVTLHGIVERAYEKSFAESIARHVPGVIDVRNKISVRPSNGVIGPTIGGS